MQSDTGPSSATFVHSVAPKRGVMRWGHARLWYIVLYIVFFYANVCERSLQKSIFAQREWVNKKRKTTPLVDKGWITGTRDSINEKLNQVKKKSQSWVPYIWWWVKWNGAAKGGWVRWSISTWKMRKERIKDQEVQHWVLQNETSNNKHKRDRRGYEPNGKKEKKKENGNSGWREWKEDQMRDEEWGKKKEKGATRLKRKGTRVRGYCMSAEICRGEPGLWDQNKK